MRYLIDGNTKDVFLYDIKKGVSCKFVGDLEYIAKTIANFVACEKTLVEVTEGLTLFRALREEGVAVFPFLWSNLQKPAEMLEGFDA
ncbi:MAG: hypothetical protein ABIQ02_08575 [Saprospiraceae bacterium]